MSHPPERTRPPALDQLRFQYQPVAPLDAGAAGWHEALVRWHRPDGTIQGPLDVLPYWLGAPRQMAFTRFTFEQAASALQADGRTRLSVNLSPRQVTQPTVIETLDGLLPEVRSRLIVELTEQPYRDAAGLWSSLEALAERCDLVLLDDVTLIDLARRPRSNAPVDGIKLDRSVLLGLLAGGADGTLRGRVREAAGRYAIVVAEGVEDPRQLEVLDGLGITHVQGFGIGRPDGRPAGAPPEPWRTPAAFAPRATPALGAHPSDRNRAATDA